LATVGAETVEPVVVGAVVGATRDDVVIDRVVVEAAVVLVVDDVVVVVAGSPRVRNQTAAPTSTTALPPRSHRVRLVGRGESSGCGGPDTWGLYAATETECRNMRKPRP
jgi:hypothetical protein